MHTNINLNTNMGGSPSPLYPGAPSYASAEEVRADLDALSEEEAEEIFARVEGARTENALLKFNGDGELASSPLALVDGLLSGGVGLDLQIGDSYVSLYESGFWAGRGSNYFSTNTSRSIFTSKLGVGMRTTPARMLEIRDSAAAQLRLTHTGGTHWVDLQAISGGGLTIASSGTFALTLPGGSGISAGGNLTIGTVSGSNSLRLRRGGSDYFVSTTSGTQVNHASISLYLRGSTLKFFDTNLSGGAGQAAFVANPTDLPTALTAIEAILAAIKSWHLMAAS